MVWPLVVAAGRFVVARGVGLMTTRMTVGSAVAVAAAPTVLSSLDGLTGHRASEALLNTPVGPALEALLSTREWAVGEQAGVVANAIRLGLVRSGAIEDGLPEDDTQMRLIQAMAHVAIGDEIGAASMAADLGLDVSDVVGAYNEARAANPDGTLQEIGVAAFQNLNGRMQEHRLGVDATAGPAGPTGDPSESAPSLRGAFLTMDPSSLQGDALDRAFDQAGQLDDDASFGFMYGAGRILVSFLESVNLFGWADSIIDRIQRFSVDAAQDALVSQGNLGLAPGANGYEPYPDGPEGPEPEGPEAALA